MNFVIIRQTETSKYSAEKVNPFKTSAFWRREQKPSFSPETPHYIARFLTRSVNVWCPRFGSQPAPFALESPLHPGHNLQTHNHERNCAVGAVGLTNVCGATFAGGGAVDLYSKILSVWAPPANAVATTAPLAAARRASDSSPTASPLLEKGGAYACPRCGNSYARPHSLNRHLRFECGVEPQFECPICHKKSKHKHNLMLHMRTHLK